MIKKFIEPTCKGYTIGNTASNDYATFTEVTCNNCGYNTSICLCEGTDYKCPNTSECRNESEIITRYGQKT